ncbi:hypothetical protein Tco_1353736 [Tanacetum coccineum]
MLRHQNSCAKPLPLNSGAMAFLVPNSILLTCDSSLSRDLFAELALGSIVAATVEVSLFICSGSVRARGIAETNVSAMVSMTSGGGVPESADEDRKIATKLNRLREEMLVIREKRRNLVDELRSIRG